MRKKKPYQILIRFLFLFNRVLRNIFQKFFLINKNGEILFNSGGVISLIVFYIRGSLLEYNFS